MQCNAIYDTGLKIHFDNLFWGLENISLLSISDLYFCIHEKILNNIFWAYNFRPQNYNKIFKMELSRNLWNFH